MEPTGITTCYDELVQPVHISLAAVKCVPHSSRLVQSLSQETEAQFCLPRRITL